MQSAGITAHAKPDAIATQRDRSLSLLFGASALWAAVWILLPLAFNNVPPCDNIEQLVWSQGLELGYHKHPPMPTWILIGAAQLLPSTIALTYGLAVLLGAIGGYFLWRLSDALLGRQAALLVVLGTACINFYSGRMHFFNHNTALIPFVYAAAWYFFLAVREGKWHHWVLLGAMSAGGMLTKYQYVIVPAAFAVIALRLGLLRDLRFLRGALLGIAVTAVLLLPHVQWLVANDFPPFKYASELVMAKLSAWERVDVSAGFFAQQIRNWLFAAGMLLIAAYAAHLHLKKSPGAALDSVVANGDLPATRHVWIQTLGFGPIVILLILGALGGMRLENHWGTTGLQFAVLPLAAWMQKRKLPSTALAVMLAFVTVTLINAVDFANKRIKESQATLDNGKIHAFDPALFSRMAVRDWYRTTSQPLRYVVGPTVFSGFVSVYSKERPEVLINGESTASPWVDPEAVTHCGAIYIAPAEPPEGAATIQGQYTARDYRRSRRGQVQTASWAVVPPDDLCAENRPNHDSGAQ